MKYRLAFRNARRGRRLKSISVLGAAILFMSGFTAYGLNQDHQHHHPEKKSEAEAPALKMTIPDIELLDQEGRRVRFYSDLIKGKVVAINFIFTTCATICPPLGATFEKVQNLMGDRMGKDVFLISISIDSVTDTPERLKAWGAKFGRKPGWTFVTGGKPEIDSLLKAMGVYTAIKEDHSPLVVIGNDAKQAWTRAYGLAPAAKLAGLIDAAITVSHSGDEQR